MPFSKITLLSLLLVLTAGTISAQTVAKPPRFEGKSATASSMSVVNPSDSQNTASLPSGSLSRALVDAAIFEAAREEGRYFTEERRARKSSDSAVKND